VRRSLEPGFMALSASSPRPAHRLQPPRPSRLRHDEAMPEASVDGEPSLCQSCSFVRFVSGSRGQRYLLCTNKTITEKYPPQPVIECRVYAALSSTEKT
jgi:hypothetical protein